MIWLAVRQSRAALLATAGATVLLAVVLVVAGGLARDLAGSVRAACAVVPGGDRCLTLQTALWGRYQTVAPYLGNMTITAVLIATFWGAPMVAREVDTGTAELLWCQSVTRRRWLGYRLAVAVGSVAVLGLLLGVAVTWWLASFTPTELGQRVFTTVWLQGPLVPAVWVGGLAVGLLVGTVARRAVPAMALTAVLSFGSVLAINLTTGLSAVVMAGPAAVLRAELWQTLPILAVAAVLVGLAFRRLPRVGA